MAFENIIGQKEVIAALEKGISTDRIGHALVFSGPAGIGKKTVARAYSKILLCEKTVNGQECGKCTSCLLFNEGTHPDFREVGPSGQSIGVDIIREQQAGAQVRPMYSKRKVFIITEAETMTVQAQNCLLKILEEPPAYLVFILAAANYEALLETVRSRSLKYSFKPNTKQEVAQWVIRNIPEYAQKADFLASLSDGIIGKAIELSSSGEFSQLREKAMELAIRLKNSGPDYVFDAARFFEDNKGFSDAILNILLLFYRDLLVALTTGNINILINSDKKDIILNNVAGFTARQLASNIENIEATRRAIKRNVNYQLSIEVMLMKLQEEIV